MYIRRVIRILGLTGSNGCQNWVGTSGEKGWATNMFSNDTGNSWKAGFFFPFSDYVKLSCFVGDLPIWKSIKDRKYSEIFFTDTSKK